MTGKAESTEYEKITIYPGDQDKEKMKLLYNALEKLGIRFNYEHY